MSLVPRQIASNRSRRHSASSHGEICRLMAFASAGVAATKTRFRASESPMRRALNAIMKCSAER